jgi:HlyD family secretion protein
MMVLTLVTSIYFRTRSENKPVELITTRLHYAPIARSVTATGTIQPVDTVEVGSQVSGTIKNIYADYNSVVRAGQLIAELDKSLLTAQASQYHANLQSAESQVVYQKQNLDRQTQLFNEKVIAKADLETAQDQYKMAAAAVESVKAQLSAAEKNLSYTNIYSPINGCGQF